MRTSRTGRSARSPVVGRAPFEDVVAAHGPTVLRVCRAVLGPVDADDAWSETFLAALRAYPRLRPGSDVAAWLVTIAHRKAIDVVRRTGRRPRPAGSAADVPARSGGDDAWESGLWDALKALPIKQRQTVAYRYLGGMSYREVARVVGGTEAAARRAAADGVAALRRSLTKGAAR